MAVTIKKAVLWRREVENRPGVLADALGHFASAGTDLKVVLGYTLDGMGAIELYPVSGKKATAAAQAAGLTASSIANLVIEGDNRPGLGHDIARAIADAGINTGFVMAQVVGRKFSAVFGFQSQDDASRAAALVKKACAAKKK